MRYSLATLLVGTALLGRPASIDAYDHDPPDREAQRDAARGHRDAARAQAEAQRDAARAQRDAERGQAEAQRDAARAQRDAARAQERAARDAARAQREVERARGRAFRDAARAQRDAMRARRDAARAQRDAMRAGRDAEPRDLAPAELGDASEVIDSEGAPEEPPARGTRIDSELARKLERLERKLDKLRQTFERFQGRIAPIHGQPAFGPQPGDVRLDWHVDVFDDQ